MKGHGDDDSPTSRESSHRMVSVPEAISITLKETFQIVKNKVSSFDIGTDEEFVKTFSSSSSSEEKIIGRVSSRDVKAPEPGYPPFRASIMDGYAVRADECKGEGSEVEEYTHTIVGKAYAGDSYESTTDSSTSNLAISSYVTTGAVVPDGFDAVVPVEEVILSDDGSALRIKKGVKSGQWIRPVGCDIPAGTIILKKNQMIENVAQIATLLQFGMTRVAVKKKIKIGVLSTGNEVFDTNSSSFSCGDTPEGKIPDVNRPMLLSLLSQMSTVTPIDLGIVPDSPKLLYEGLTSALTSSIDILITTGGVSMGEKDYLEPILSNQLPVRLLVGRLHMKPGKPTKIFIYKNQKIILALPGNPVSAFVCTHLLLTPILNTMQYGDTLSSFTDIPLHDEIEAVYKGETIPLDFERPEYHRVSISYENQTFVAVSTGVQRSSRIMSLFHADGFMCLPRRTRDKKEIRNGERVLVLRIRRHPIATDGGGVPFKRSKHMLLNKVKTKTVYGVQIINVGHPASAYEQRVKDILGPYYRIQHTSNIDPAPSTFQKSIKNNILQTEENIHILVIVVQDTTLNFTRCLSVSDTIANICSRTNRRKEALALALQAKRGATRQFPACALFEFIAEWNNGKMVLVVPESGLEGALDNVKGLLGHAIALASGKKGHHHKHRH